MSDELVPQGAPEEVSSDASATEEHSAAADEQLPETAEDSETSEDDEEPEEQPQPKKTKGGFQRRIDRLTQEKRYLEGLVSQLAGGKQPAEQQAQEQPVKASDKPQAKDFNDYDEYVVALGRWGADQRLAEERTQNEKLSQKQRQQQQQNEWETRQDAARKQLKDYDDVLADAADVPMSNAMQAAIVESELGPQVAYHLAKNPAEAKRIAQLSPIAAAREIGRLEAKLTPPPQKKANPVTKAPEPIRPVGSKSGAAKKPLREVNDFAEYYRRRMAGER